MSTDIPTDIDRSAPVTTEHRIDISAEPQEVWDLHVAVDRWPDWNPAIVHAQTPSPLTVGVTFGWESYGLAVDSTVYAFDPPRRILWGGSSGGITGIHEWRFEGIHSGSAAGTRVTTRESWSGEPVEADLQRSSTALEDSLTAWLAALKTAVEERH